MIFVIDLPPACEIQENIRIIQTSVSYYPKTTDVEFAANIIYKMIENSNIPFIALLGITEMYKENHTPENMTAINHLFSSLFG